MRIFLRIILDWCSNATIRVSFPQDRILPTVKYYISNVSNRYAS